ncbi:hypothetical protein C0Q70_08563 [Pomacea canaliculata]|uniref:Sulfotransferase domain-containing protein n=2 Tax=Pomacea canaliculata TaxID=400727 RepID=A0A2T7PI76_POMCA|nr:hypothetical protein C0Q70_08563 [Pomacea canaliculata]
MNFARRWFHNCRVPLVEVDGLPLPPFYLTRDAWSKHLNSIRAMKLRGDDVIICAYPKAGTHWVWEMTAMLLKEQAEYESRAKELLMLDLTPVKKLDVLPSPRILNTHLPFLMLPVQQILAERVKVVHVYRNPKDVMVSMYHHMRQFPLVRGHADSLQQCLQAFLTGRVIYGHYGHFLNQMNSFMEDNPGVPVFNIAYEDIKKDPRDSVRRLAEFLGVDVTQELVEDIVEACSFSKMKKVDEIKEQVAFFGMPIGQKLYRKGKVGDWENHLTEEESQLFDTDFSKVLDTTRFHFQDRL